jgi:hypothetical protein
VVTSYRDGGVTLRPRLIRAAFRLEWLTVGWIVVEAAVALASGVSAGSISLTAFGLDSLIELSAVPGFPLSEAVIQSVLAPGQMHLLFGANGDGAPAVIPAQAKACAGMTILRGVRILHAIGLQPLSRE